MILNVFVCEVNSSSNYVGNLKRHRTKLFAPVDQVPEVCHSGVSSNYTSVRLPQL